MTELDRLPPDQRAVLSLVLDRGKSYAEVAELLGIPENTVRDRAHTALDALAEGIATPRGSRAARAHLALRSGTTSQSIASTIRRGGSRPPFECSEETRRRLRDETRGHFRGTTSAPPRASPATYVDRLAAGPERCCSARSSW